jgi:hypothetical protein
MGTQDEGSSFLQVQEKSSPSCFLFALTVALEKLLLPLARRGIFFFFSVKGGFIFIFTPLLLLQQT